MKLGLSADEVLSTTRAVRKRLDFDKPVPRGVIEECLEFALQSPTGSNTQAWQWLVVTDADKRAAIADHYRSAFTAYAANALAEQSKTSAQNARVVNSATYLADNFHRVPAMLIPCLPGRFENTGNMGGASSYGSILPGVWSFMLAARERGLGTAWTTLHLMHEKEVADIVGIPFDEVTQCALVTIGYSIGTDFKAAARPPLDTVLHWDTW